VDNLNNLECWLNTIKKGGDRMRLKLDFELEKPELDIDYRRCLISFIKHSIQGYDQNLFEDLYEKGKTRRRHLYIYTISTYIVLSKYCYFG